MLGREKGSAPVLKRWNKGREQEQNYNKKKSVKKNVRKKRKTRG